MIKGLFDVYNLGQHITGRRNWYCWKNRYCGKFCQNGGKEFNWRITLFFVAFAPKDNPKLPSPF
jgi:hypothetical protein